jgi:hypothetical protein
MKPKLDTKEAQKKNNAQKQGSYYLTSMNNAYNIKDKNRGILFESKLFQTLKIKE